MSDHENNTPKIVEFSKGIPQGEADMRKRIIALAIQVLNGRKLSRENIQSEKIRQLLLLGFPFTLVADALKVRSPTVHMERKAMKSRLAQQGVKVVMTPCPDVATLEQRARKAGHLDDLHTKTHSAPIPHNPFDLSKKHVLVTGGNGGIGLGMAKGLAAAGAQVSIWGTNPQKNADALKILQSANPDKPHRADVVDVSDEQAVVNSMNSLHENSPLNSVFVNAGVGSAPANQAPQPFINMSDEEMRRVFSVNLFGATYTAREAAKILVNQNQGGSIAVVSSLSAMEGAARAQHYASSKGAMLALMRACAVEFGRWNIRVNAVVPGWIATDMTQGAQDSPAFAQKVIPRIPIRRWGQPDDFAGVAVYLASDASKYHSGDSFVIDGGYAVF